MTAKVTQGCLLGADGVEREHSEHSDGASEGYTPG